MSSAFRCQRLSKTFDDVAALDRVSLELRRPSIIGLLGRNGSGKTTLLRHVTGLALPWPAVPWCRLSLAVLQRRAA